MYAASLYAVGPDRPDESDGPHRVPAAGSRLANALRRLPGKPSDRSARHPDPATYGADRKDILASHAHVPHRQLLPAESACRKCGQRMVTEHRTADHPAGKRAGRPEPHGKYIGILLQYGYTERLLHRRSSGSNSRRATSITASGTRNPTASIIVCSTKAARSTSGIGRTEASRQCRYLTTA